MKKTWPGTVFVVLLFSIAVIGSACATLEKQAYDAAAKMVEKICEQPEDIREVERTKLWNAFGVDTTQVCVPKDQRVKPPTIP